MSMKPTLEAPRTQLAELLTSKMEEQGMTMNELAEKLDVTYEHVRRIVRGEGIPSKYVLKLIAEVFKFKYHDLEKIAVSDKIKKKYGSIPAELAGKDPTLEPLEKLWFKLHEEQRAALIDMASSFARRNRIAKAS
jgi:transcriptional regulator with XRE-family HTH domain